MSALAENTLLICDQAGRDAAEKLATVFPRGTLTQDQMRSVINNTGRTICNETRQIERTLDAFLGRLTEIARSHGGGGQA